MDRAIAVIDSLITRDDLDSGEADYLDVLGDLVHKYEAKHDPIAPVSDAETVQFLLESNEMAQTELAERSGIAQSTISEPKKHYRRYSRPTRRWDGPIESSSRVDVSATHFRSGKPGATSRTRILECPFRSNHPLSAFVRKTMAAGCVR